MVESYTKCILYNYVTYILIIIIIQQYDYHLLNVLNAPVIRVEMMSRGYDVMTVGRPERGVVIQINEILTSHMTRQLPMWRYCAWPVTHCISTQYGCCCEIHCNNNTYVNKLL